jgi:hypothetical protein
MGELEQDQGGTSVPAGDAAAAAGADPRLGKGDPRHAKLVMSLASCPKILRIYPPGHIRAGAYLTEFERVFAELLEARHDPLVISVEKTRVLIDGQRVKIDDEINANLGIMLARRSIERIEILSGIQREEIQLLVELLGTPFKDVLRQGGTEAWIERTEHPNLQVIMVDPDQLSPREGWGAIQSVLDGCGIDETLITDELRERLADLREAYLEALSQDTGYAGEEEATFINLVREFLEHPDWANMPRKTAMQALERFVEILHESLEELTAGGDQPLSERIESMRSYFRGLAPENGSQPVKADHTETVNELRFEIARLDEFLESCHSTDRPPAEILRSEIVNRVHFRNALVVICELLLGARNEPEYLSRRQLFVDALSSGDYPTSAIARTLRFVTVDLPSIRFEPREHLVNAAVDGVSDDEALQHFLVSMTEYSHLVHPILQRLATRADPFPLLVRLLRVPLLEAYRATLQRKFREAAGLRYVAFRAWVRANLDDFFDDLVFQPLIKRGTELLGALCKEIFMEGTPRDRQRLVERLSRDGSETALRLLVLGVPFDGTPCSPEVLATLGEFRSPLASGALREIVFRANTGEIHPDEARAALEALVRQEGDAIEDGEDFVRCVAEGYSWGLPRYKRSLRRLAASVLESDRWL